MERILQSSEMAEIILVPIRHHSPACSYHLQKLIEAERPDTILIEGPSNANELMNVMLNDQIKPPFALYYSYNDKNGIISKEKEQYKCYYPFIDYSPEYVAIRKAKEYGCLVSFIDLPYAEIARCKYSQKTQLLDDKSDNYNDDYLLTTNAYITRLCEKAGLRNFDEFWEKYYEVNGLQKDSKVWFDELYEYCKIAREHTDKESYYIDGTLNREICMAYKIILEAITNVDRKILVVTGGIHTVALKDRIINIEETKKEYQKLIKKEISKDNQEVYVIPYTIEALASINGYASGMPYPGYYKDIWNMLNADDNKVSKAYYDTALTYLVEVGKNIRKEEGTLSTDDEISAFMMATQLANLRNKSNPGAYELHDAVLSCYVKGEVSISTRKPLDILTKKLTGTGIGKVGEDAGVPPIVEDFNNICKKYKIGITSTINKELTLSFYAKDSHREISRFLHRLEYLKIPFATMKKGPNLQMKTNKNLIREIWSYKWNASVYASLIDRSVYGQTIEIAASVYAENELKKELNAKETAILYTHIFEMGLEKYAIKVAEKLKSAVINDNDFFSLSEALSYFEVLLKMSPLYSFNVDIEDIIKVTIRKIITVLNRYSNVKDDDLNSVMNIIKIIYQFTKVVDKDGNMLANIDDYVSVLNVMRNEKDINAGINGCIYGIFYSVGIEDTATIKSMVFGYLNGTKDQISKTSAFLRGLFFVARDIIFRDEEFVAIIDDFISKTESEQFMRMLPELRMAFAYFTPMEIDRIAKSVAQRYSIEDIDMIYEDAIDAEFFEYGKLIDEYAKGGIINE